MKKEFLDYLYELRGAIQIDIDRLVERQEQDICPDSDNDFDAELRMRRGEIQSCNKTIENYLKTHTFF